MQNQDIFKQAIAEAKSVREAAIANAKESIEESLTPHLKELLAAKLREMEETDEELTEAEHTEEEETMEEAAKDEAENDTEESEDDAEDAEEKEGEDLEADTEGEEEEVDLETLTVDDLRDMIRDIVAQETAPGADMDMDMGMDTSMEPGVDDMVGLDEPSSDEEEIDLDELLAELDNLAGEEVEEAMHMKKKDSAMKEKKSYMEMKKPAMKEKKSYMEMKDDEYNEMKDDLQEAVKTITLLQKDLSEVNLLNSKLLFVNKLFKSQNLSEAQKAHVIATFDKAETSREAKLVYESFKTSLTKSATTSKSTQIKEHRSFASKATGVTSTNKNTPKDGVIQGVSEQVRRMQKLAGII